MDNMFKLMGWWTGIFAVLFFAGDMYTASLLFVASTVFFLLLGYLNLNRAYVYVHVCQLFNGVHGWFQLLRNVYTRTRWWTLISHTKKQPLLAVFLFNKSRIANVVIKIHLKTDSYPFHRRGVVDDPCPGYIIKSSSNVNSLL